MSAPAKLVTAVFCINQTPPVTEFIAPMHINHGYTPAVSCRMVVRGRSQKLSRIIKQEPGPMGVIVLLHIHSAL